jgi:HEAT repeat protein
MTQPMEGSSNHFALILGFPGPRSLETRMARTASAVAVAALISSLLLASPIFAQTESQQPTRQTPSDSTPASPSPAASANSSADRDDAPTKPPAEDNSPRTHVSAWQMLSDGVKSQTVARRQEALAALGTLGTRERAVHLVVAALDDKDPSVRELAARNLGQMHAKSAIPKLREALNDDSAGVSFAAAKSLWDMGDRSGRGVFMEILSGEKSNSTGMMKDQLESAKKRLQDPRSLAMIGAKEAASSLFGPAGWGITIVEEVTKDRSASARAMSAALLGHDAGKDAVRELDEAIWDKNWIVRVAAAQALGECRQRDQIQHLRGLLWDAKPAVRYMAAASIIRLSSSRSAAGFRSTKPPGPAAALQMPRTSK